MSNRRKTEWISARVVHEIFHFDISAFDLRLVIDSQIGQATISPFLGWSIVDIPRSGHFGIVAVNPALDCYVVVVAQPAGLVVPVSEENVTPSVCLEIPWRN
jgi:hypothetical protein